MGTFNGFENPQSNYVKVPDAFWHITDLTVHQKTVLLYILRHTWGYQEFGIYKSITIDEFQKGRKRSDSSRMDAGVGISRGSAHKSLKVLEEKGYIEVNTDAKDAARVKKSYRLNMAKDSVQEMNTAFTERTQRSPIEHSVSPDERDQRKTLKKDTKRKKKKDSAPVGAAAKDKPQSSKPEVSPFNDTSHQGLFGVVARQSQGFKKDDNIPEAMGRRIGKDVAIIREMSEPPSVAELTEMFRDWRTMTNPDTHVPVDGAKIVRAINLWRGSPGHHSFQHLKLVALQQPDEIMAALMDDLPEADEGQAPELVEDVSDDELLAMMAALTASKCHPSKKNAPPPRKALA